LHDLATHFVCSYCRSYNDIQQRTCEKIEDRKAFELLWPLGKSGQFGKYMFQLVGAVLRKEQGTQYQWQEYCFFHPIGGFLYLSEYTGNWILLRETKIFPHKTLNTTTIEDNFGKEYDLFLRYKTACINLVGEFPFNAKDTDLKIVKEFIAPPFMYLKKEYKSEIVWYKGEHIAWKEVKNSLGEAAFKVEKVGKGSIEPQKLGMNYVSFIIYACITVLLMVGFTWYYESNNEPKIAFENTFFLDAQSNQSKPLASEPFLLEGSTNNVALHFVNSDINQTWMEVEASLINEETDEEFILTRELYFYTGSDSEGPWTDNNRSGTEIISNIPAGRYHLQLTPYFSSEIKETRLGIQVIRGVPNRSNLYWLIAILALLCFLHYQRILYFEKKRWSNSNYSTYDHRTWVERSFE